VVLFAHSVARILFLNIAPEVKTLSLFVSLEDKVRIVFL
jgi:hypothetical protein